MEDHLEGVFDLQVRIVAHLVAAVEPGVALFGLRVQEFSFTTPVRCVSGHAAVRLVNALLTVTSRTTPQGMVVVEMATPGGRSARGRVLPPR